MMNRVAQPVSTHNLLIVSDLHLGADLKRPEAGETRTSWLRAIATLDREFGAFLDWYATHREGDRPWRLIVNGDMVDFINVTLVPDAGDAEILFEIRDEERRFGLDGDEAKVTWMLGRVIERHRGLFMRLAAFVAAGNELAIVRGNHDVEWHWPGVQNRFREILADLAPEGAERAAIGPRVTFLPWFYYEPDTIFVEHGHQYDEYSSFEYLLAPVAPGAPARVDLPLSHYAIRYLANAFPGISTHDKDGWGFLDFLRFGLSGKGGSLSRLFLGYVATLRRVGSGVLMRKFSRKRETRTHHGLQLARLGEQWGLSLERLRSLERLHRGHALRSAFRAAQCYYADRFALVAVVGAVPIVLAESGLHVAIALALATVLLLVVNRLLARTRKSEIHPKLATAGRAVALLLNVPLVVMGHSHRAARIVDPGVEVGAAPAACYVNTGTWIPAKDAVGFTHLAVRRGTAGPDAELRRWDAGERKPVRFGDAEAPVTARS